MLLGAGIACEERLTDVCDLPGLQTVLAPLVHDHGHVLGRVVVEVEISTRWVED